MNRLTVTVADGTRVNDNGTVVQASPSRPTRHQPRTASSRSSVPIPTDRLLDAPPAPHAATVDVADAPWFALPTPTSVRAVVLHEVDVRPLRAERLEAFIGRDRSVAFTSLAGQARALLDGRAVVNVNSTATGGGVAELLETLLSYARGAGVDARWLVIKGDHRFFQITKRIHNCLYGTPGDGGPLGDSERRDYEDTMARHAADLSAVVRAGDIVVLHDPQTAGLVPAVRRSGGRVIWRSHVGVDVPNEHSDLAWRFLRPYVEDVDFYVFSCARFAPPWVPGDRLTVIPPSIDPFSAKNVPIEPEVVVRTLQRVGALLLFRTLPDHAGISLQRHQRFAGVGPFLQFLDRDVIERLPAGTAREQRAGNVDHVRRARALI